MPDPIDDDPRPLEPERPLNTDCCGSGCNPCIFDLYQSALQDYRQALHAWEIRQAERSRPRRKT